MEEIIKTPPKSPRMAIIGEAYGAEEELAGEPFVGPSGRLLKSLLASVGIEIENCLITNVFNFRPPNNKLKAVLVTRKDAAAGWTSFNKKYLPESLVPEVERLRAEVKAFAPDGIICLGAFALWGLTGYGSLSPHRGHYHEYNGVPMIPTYHPARVLRSYFLKTSLAADLEKAKRLSTGELQLDDLKFNPEPSLIQIREFIDKVRKIGIVSADIETSPKVRSITCIGFGTTDFSICVPFYHKDKPHFNYWETASEEVEALRLCKELLEDRKITKIFHKMNYDIPWISTIWGINVRGPIIDTMIEHSCLLAELPHSLSDISANYLVMPPWKSLWQSSKEADATKDESEE